MKKYWTVFNISWQNGFIYRLNFLLWRIRGLIITISVYFLWQALLTSQKAVLGYNQEKILTYIFMVLLIRSLVLSVRSIDVGGEISSGRLSNYLLKPVNYHFYWFTRDLADKLLNIIFSVIEISVLFFILKPPIFVQTDIVTLALFLISLIFVSVLNFIIGFITSTSTFWTPGNTWGLWFVYLVFQETLSGLMFPIDILPKWIYDIVTLLPFPYLLYFPVNLYLGKIVGWEIFRGFIIIIGWLIVLSVVFSKFWKMGLKTYQSEGQ